MKPLSDSEYKDILRRNPDISVHETVVWKRPAIPVESDKDKLKTEFETLWAWMGGPDLATEHRFHPLRRWRFDYAHLDSKIAVEINGGIWTNGRHVRGGGYLRDREKINAAQLLGWIVIELGTGKVTAENVQMVIEAIAESRKGAAR